jgi:Tfp pilus assembly protein PilF
MRPARRRLVTAVVAGLLAGCAAPEPAPPPTGLTDLIERPAERSLFDAMRAYDDGNYGQAEAALHKALDTGLASPHDQATAHKLLAFITCTSNRVVECAAAFRAARAAYPSFTLSRSEAGHPVWGPVYQHLSQ